MVGSYVSVVVFFVEALQRFESLQPERDLIPTGRKIETYHRYFGKAM